MLYCFYFSDTEAFEACFRLLHDDDDDEVEFELYADIPPLLRASTPQSASPRQAYSAQQCMRIQRQQSQARQSVTSHYNPANR